jgi:hypothetical protein
VSYFAWLEFVDWYQLIAVVSEHLMYLEISGSTLFDEI